MNRKNWLVIIVATTSVVAALVALTVGDVDCGDPLCKKCPSGEWQPSHRRYQG